MNPLPINIDCEKFLNNDDDIALPPISAPTPISVWLPPTPPTNPFPNPNLEMTPEEEQFSISNLINDPSTLPPEVPIKEKNGKLGLMWPRNYALDHPVIPLIIDYAQNGCSVDCDKYWTFNQIILMLERVPHLSAKDPEATRQICE